MDAYTKTWMQFVFPVYTWAIVGLMVLVGHFSHRFANLLGNNQAGTLILLSCTKILRILIMVLDAIYLEYPTYTKEKNGVVV